MKGNTMEEYLLDDPAIELVFQEILRKVRTLQNGITAASMAKRGISYKVNLGASIISLQHLASGYSRNHLLAFKLWNKQWRESMILATLLEEPEKVTSNQMDFWVRNFQAVEMAEQAVMNLFSKTPFAFEKAYEYCLGKKTITKITGLLLIGRLAINEKEVPDEKFDLFFELMPPLSKDPQLSVNFIRAYTQIGMKSDNLRKITLKHAQTILTIDSETARFNAQEIIQQLS
jgi:3-methyladenine DNA glycosylase AlkD